MKSKHAEEKYMNIKVDRKYNSDNKMTLPRFNAGHYKINDKDEIIRLVTLFRTHKGEFTSDYNRLLKKLPTKISEEKTISDTLINPHLDGLELQIYMFEKLSADKNTLYYMSIYGKDLTKDSIILDKHKFESLVKTFESGKISRKLYEEVKRNLYTNKGIIKTFGQHIPIYHKIGVYLEEVK